MPTTTVIPGPLSPSEATPDGSVGGGDTVTLRPERPRRGSPRPRGSCVTVRASSRSGAETVHHGLAAIAPDTYTFTAATVANGAAPATSGTNLAIR